MKFNTHQYGYHMVSLCVRGYAHTITVHKLVALVFLGPRPPGLVVCHNDGIPTNNHIRNLRYDTHVANNNDAVLHGTAYIKLGVEHPHAVFTEDQIRAIRTSSEPNVVLSRRYHVHTSTIKSIRSRRTWKHVT